VPTARAESVAAAQAASEPAPPPATEPGTQPETSSPKKRPAPKEDRLKKALRELPHGEHSVARIAKAAGLNHEKTLRRLHSLHAAGEVQQIGKRWSNEPPSTDIEAAMDRLQARTTNLRVVTRREPVG
jgi:predicted Rossmann fold nucleotide-binding protein DprA/Smf involved in DNA uptake